MLQSTMPKVERPMPTCASCCLISESMNDYDQVKSSFQTLDSSLLSSQSKKSIPLVIPNFLTGSLYPTYSLSLAAPVLFFFLAFFSTFLLPFFFIFNTRGMMLLCFVYMELTLTVTHMKTPTWQGIVGLGIGQKQQFFHFLQIHAATVVVLGQVE